MTVMKRFIKPAGKMNRLNPIDQNPIRLRLKWVNRKFISKKMSGMHTQKGRRLLLVALFPTTGS